MIIPCVDLMGGKVVQLVQGRRKALEGDTPLATLERFAAFSEVQIIDLDAAMGQGSNDAIVRELAGRTAARVGGGVRTVDRASALLGAGARKIIVGTAAFRRDGVNEDFLAELASAVGTEQVLLALDSQGGRIVVRGWRESTNLKAEELIPRLEPYCAGFLCTYIDKEGMLQGTDLEWFRRLRGLTGHEITAAGGVTTMAEIETLDRLRVHAALGMAIYTGKLALEELASWQRSTQA
jgi:phosphoribosylformimino-5-aminoimidazole carboxamide ribotide isomerase